MHLASLNIGIATSIAGKPSGIFKKAVELPLAISTDGVDGDSVCDARHHGGPDQAVYVYGIDDYAWWSEQLGFRLAPGTFGDNLTIAGLTSAEVGVGDRLTVGEVELEVTAPRIPCAVLGRRMQDETFPIAFRNAERPGFYCRVLTPGIAQTGEPVSWTSGTVSRIPLLEAFRFYYEPTPSLAELRRFLAAPIASRERERLQGLLEKLGPSQAQSASE